MAALQRLYVKPSTFKDVLRNIADDGLDYLITFYNGEYSFLVDSTVSPDTPSNDDSVLIDHHSGGAIIIKSHISRNAVFNEARRSGGEDMLSIICPRVELHGLTLDAGVYSSAPAATVKQPCRISMGTGERADFLNPTRCNPHTLIVTDCLLKGDDAKIYFLPSNDCRQYTDITLCGNEYDEVGTSAAFNIKGFDDSLTEPPPAPTLFNAWCYAHIVADDNKGHGYNGPDGPAWGGANTNHHNASGMGIEISELHGESTYLETRSNFTMTITGSENHDLHVERVGRIYGSQVQMTWRDCDYKGIWASGHITGDGGGNTWLWYYHSGGPSFDVTDPADRPNFTFENCHFTATIGADVPLTESTGGGNDYFLATCQSSGTYNFWDCHFTWVDNAGYFAVRGSTKTPTGISLSRNVAAANITHELTTHSLISTFPSPSTNTPVLIFLQSPIAGNKWTADDNTKYFSGPQLWGRPTAFSQVRQNSAATIQPTLVDPEFELNASVWTFSNFLAERRHLDVDPPFLENDRPPEVANWTGTVGIELGVGPTTDSEMQWVVTHTPLDHTKAHVLQYHLNVQEGAGRPGLLIVRYRLNARPWVNFGIFNPMTDLVNNRWGKQYFEFFPSVPYTEVTFSWSTDSSPIGGPILYSPSYYVDVVNFSIC